MTNFATDASMALSAPRRAGPLIAIASGKGGVGKTTSAACWWMRIWAWPMWTCSWV